MKYVPHIGNAINIKILWLKTVLICFLTEPKTKILGIMQNINKTSTCIINITMLSISFDKNPALFTICNMDPDIIDKITKI